tara:strand:- start:82 stop:276 length:195 start_codon:yes stop_codon:yes gene_type:complete
MARLCTVSEEREQISEAVIAAYLVNSSEGKISTLANFPIFRAVYPKWGIPSSCKLLLVCVVDSK